MQVTIELDEILQAVATARAAETGATVTAVLEDALREALLKQFNSAQRKPIRLKTFRGDGVCSGVNLDDSAALLALMKS